MVCLKFCYDSPSTILLPQTSTIFWETCWWWSCATKMKSTSWTQASPIFTKLQVSWRIGIRKLSISRAPSAVTTSKMDCTLSTQGCLASNSSNCGRQHYIWWNHMDLMYTNMDTCALYFFEQVVTYILRSYITILICFIDGLLYVYINIMFIKLFYFYYFFIYFL